MFLNLNVSDAVGKSRGAVRMKLDFGRNQWSVDSDKQNAWQGVGYSGSGAFELQSNGVMWIWDQGGGGAKQNTVIIWDSPVGESDAQHPAGSARIFAPKDSAYKEGKISWKVETAVASAPAVPSGAPSLSPIRLAMLKLLEKVPKTNLSSNDPVFKTLTGFDTARLKKEYWDIATVVDKTDPEQKRTIPNPQLHFTTCNAFLGKIVGMLGAKPGSWLCRGILELNLVDRDVKGSWIPQDPTGVKKPQAGDIYSIPHASKDGKGKVHIQPFGHVGIIGSIDGTQWMSVDGGQGGRDSIPQLDYIKWVPRGKYNPTMFTGWCDIDIYFAGIAGKK